MISPKRCWTQFSTIEEKIEKLKYYQIISSTATEVKKLYYKGTYSNYEAVECDVVGYVDDYEIVLSVNEELHSILPECFVDMQKRERFIVLDIETPGSFSPSSGICEVAAVFVEDYRVTDSIHLAIINNKENYKLGYGKGLEHIEENDEFKEIFKSFIKKYRCPIIAHNASFDRSFLKYWEWIDDKQKFYCSMNNIKNRIKLPNYKLVTLLNHFNIKHDQSHTAMDDVLDLLEVLKNVKVDKWTFLGESSSNSVKDSQDNSKEEQVKSNKFKYLSKDDKASNKKRLEDAKNNIISDALDGKRIVFTGDMTKERIDMMEIAIMHGATVTTGISSKTTLVVLGDNPGASKVAKATDLNIETISENDFFEIINISSLRG